MGDFRRYKDLDIWKRAFGLGLMIFNLCNKIPSNSTNRVLINQITRSVTSIAGNIAEGSGASTKRDFLQYLNVARKSALETDNWLKFICANNKINTDTKRMLFTKTQEIIKILTTIIKKSKFNNY